jgi:hypothetical protein
MGGRFAVCQTDAAPGEIWEINPDTMKEPGAPRKVRLGAYFKPQVYPFQETPECYTSVSTGTRVN